MLIASCSCGQTKFELAGTPIASAACHCASCRTAAARFVQLGAPSVLDADGGVPLILARKDRVRCVSGYENLRAYRLTETTNTRRTLARCCNSPMFIDPGAHWLSFFHDRLGSHAPPTEMRLSRASSTPPSDGVPSAKSISPRLVWRIARAWAAMGFRTPKLEPIEEAPYPSETREATA